MRKSLAQFMAIKYLEHHKVLIRYLLNTYLFTLQIFNNIFKLRNFCF